MLRNPRTFHPFIRQVDPPAHHPRQQRNRGRLERNCNSCHPSNRRNFLHSSACICSLQRLHIFLARLPIRSSDFSKDSSSNSKSNSNRNKRTHKIRHNTRLQFTHRTSQHSGKPRRSQDQDTAAAPCRARRARRARSSKKHLRSTGSHTVHITSRIFPCSPPNSTAAPPLPRQLPHRRHLL